MASELLSFVEPESKRRFAEFPPTVWGSYFASFDSETLKLDEKIEEEVQMLKEEVKNMLVASLENPAQTLNLIDSIQRLGVAYHVEEEIQSLLEKLNHTYVDSMTDGNDNNLCSDALLFRLLRQQGYRISSDIFKKYIDHEGKFKEFLAKDVYGLLSLYEAANFSVHGEDILDRALIFAFKNLEAIVGHLSYPLSEKVSYALKHPLRRGMPRLEASHFMPIYKEDPSHNIALLAFANLDYNIHQKLHQKELGHVSRWWKDLHFPSMLPFARDRIAECYLWALIIRPEPQYSTLRMFLAKVIQMVTILDDTYDVYGTLEEITLLTDAIERWNISAQDKLPHYLKFYYQNVLRLFMDFESDEGNKIESFQMLCAKDAMKRLAKDFFGEVNWLHVGHIPTMDEYYELALPSSCYQLFSVIAYLCLGETIPKETFHWIFTQPKILRGAEIIGRLMNDIMSHKFERGRWHIPSAVECYIKQYEVSEEEACNGLQMRVDNAWKDINECCLKPTEFSMDVLSPIINLARASHVSYREEDGFTNVAGATKHYITTLIIDPISL